MIQRDLGGSVFCILRGSERAGGQGLRSMLQTRRERPSKPVLDFIWDRDQMEPCAGGGAAAGSSSARGSQIKVRRSHLFLSDFGTFRISSCPAVDPGWLDPSTLCTGWGCNWTRSKTLSQTWLAGLAGYTGPAAARPHHSRFDSTLLRRACSQAQALSGLATMSPVDDVHRWLFETHPRAGVAVRPPSRLPPADTKTEN